MDLPIAIRKPRVTARLRAIEHAYRTVIDPDATPGIDPTQISRSAATVTFDELLAWAEGLLDVTDV